MMCVCVYIRSETQLAQDMLNTGMGGLSCSQSRGTHSSPSFSFHREPRHCLHNPASRELPETIKHCKMNNNPAPGAKNTPEQPVFLPAQPLQQHVRTCLQYASALRRSSQDTSRRTGGEPGRRCRASLGHAAAKPHASPASSQNQHTTPLPSPGKEGGRGGGGVCMCVYT